MAYFAANSVLQSRLLPGIRGASPLPQVCHIHKRPRTSSLGRTLRATPAEDGPKETKMSTPWTALEKFIAQRESAYVVEPLARTFLLGVAAGTLVEVGHIMYKFLGLLTDVGTEKVLQVFPSVADQFSPLFFVDHAAAFAAWFVLYSLEMVAVSSLLERSVGQEDNTEELSNLRTLSKKLLPLGVQTEITKMLLNLKNPALADAPQMSKTVGLSSMPKMPTVAPTPSTSGRTTAEPPQTSRGAESSKSSGGLSTPMINPPKTDVNEPGEDQVKRRQKEIAERKSFLRNFWYAAALSENVGKEPHPVEILGMKLVLYRGDDGQVHCLRDSCPHRSAPLSDGSITKIDGHNCLVCPYHGWAIDGKGTIQDVPSEERGQWPKSPQVENYVVEERGGFIWLFYEGPKGNRLPADERPPIPCIPELDDPNWTPVYGELEFDCGHWAVFENAIDMAHIHYLHNDSFGNDDKPVVMNMEGTSDAFGVTTTFNIHNKPVSPLWNFTAVDSVPVEAKALLPSTSMIKIQLGMGIEFITYVCTVPISENKCINRFALLRNFLPWAPEVWEPWARNAMYKILGEDKVMIETLRPEETLREVSVRADLPQILFRKLRQEYINMGYGYRHKSYDHAE